MKKIPVIQPYFTNEEYEEIKKVLDSGWVAQGPKTAEFEKMIAAHEGVMEGIAVTSCTTALQLVMYASGIGAGMDVFVPAFTFVATANSVVMCGANPVLIDVSREDYNMIPQAVRDKIASEYEARSGLYYHRISGNRLWGIVPVHQFGLCADMPQLNAIAEEFGFSIIEDAACALGARIGETHIGAFGNPACVSFHPRKSITTGEGGMVLVNDVDLAKRMRELRSHGSTLSADARDAGKGYLLPEFNEAGFNYRMTDLQAAMGIAQARKLDYFLEERRKLALRYDRLIQDQLPQLIVPRVPEGYYHTYQSYVCMLNPKALGIDDLEEAADLRNALLEELEQIGIATRQGTHAVHILGYYRKTYGYQKEDFPNAYACDRLSITLPLSVQMTQEDQEYVVSEIKKIMEL